MKTFAKPDEVRLIEDDSIKKAGGKVHHPGPDPVLCRKAELDIRA
jgi:hypothetical protein